MSTERQAAPPDLIGFARRGGSKCSRIKPFDGLAFLISAIRAKRPARLCALDSL